MFISTPSRSPVAAGGRDFLFLFSALIARCQAAGLCVGKRSRRCVLASTAGQVMIAFASRRDVHRAGVVAAGTGITAAGRAAGAAAAARARLGGRRCGWGSRSRRFRCTRRRRCRWCCSGWSGRLAGVRLRGHFW